jgi:putative septum site-determining protein minC
MFNFRFTKELGSLAELSFMANNFLNIRKYHINSNTQGKSQLHPDTYFGAEIKLKF